VTVFDQNDYPSVRPFNEEKSFKDHFAARRETASARTASIYFPVLRPRTGTCQVKRPVETATSGLRDLCAKQDSAAWQSH
jgi:hypothetical protein